MAYVPVPKDLTKVKTKVALNLTKRQLIFFSLAAVVGIPFYLFMRKSIGSSIAAILMVTIMLPSFFIAMYEKDGLPFEKVVTNMIRRSLSVHRYASIRWKICMRKITPLSEKRRGERRVAKRKNDRQPHRV